MKKFNTIKSNKVIINLIKLQPFQPHSKIQINLNNIILLKKHTQSILQIKIKPI